MKKSELMEIATRNSMDFIRNPVTQEGVGVWCRSAALIPTLDQVVDGNCLPVSGERIAEPDSYLYRIFCPSEWINLYGWNEQD